MCPGLAEGGPFRNQSLSTLAKPNSHSGNCSIASPTTITRNSKKTHLIPHSNIPYLCPTFRPPNTSQVTLLEPQIWQWGERWFSSYRLDHRIGDLFLLFLVVITV